MAGKRRMGRPPGNPIERFWAKVEQGPGCWIWTASRDRKGYGWFWHLRRNMQAHVASYLLHLGEIPEGMCVLHKCDNPWCVRPEHLFLGTHADNAADRHQKGRDARGEKHGNARLTKALVDEAREQYAAGIPQNQLAERMGVSTAAMSAAIRGVTWAQPN